MTEQEEAERRHCEEVALGTPGDIGRQDLANLIARERSDARRQALEEAAAIADDEQQDAVGFGEPEQCGIYLGVVAKRIRALASPKP